MIAIRRFLRHRGGSSAIEFALLAGPFLLLVFGVIELSRGLWTRQALIDIAGNAARCVAVLQLECVGSDGKYSLDATRAYIREEARGLGVALIEPIVVQRDTTCNGLAGFSSVAVDARFDSVFPISELIDMSSQSCFARQG